MKILIIEDEKKSAANLQKGMQENGFEVDLANALGQKLNRRAAFVQNEWDGLISGLRRGDYDIVLRMDGYQTLKTHARLKPAAVEIPPIDLFVIFARPDHSREYPSATSFPSPSESYPTIDPAESRFGVHIAL